MSRKNTICIWILVAWMAAALFGCNTSPQAKGANYMKRGAALLAKKDYSRSVLEFRNAAQAMPRDAEPFYQMGLAYLGSANIPEAAQALRKATELNPKHTGAQLKLAEILAATRSTNLIEEAAQRVETVLANAPDNSDASDILALTEWKLGRTEDAVRRLEETLQKFPAHLESSVALAKVKLTRNDLPGALEVVRKAVASAPKSPEAALALGQLYLISGQPEKAQAELQRVLQLDPTNGPALQALAAVQVSAHRTDEAERTYGRLSALPAKEYKPLHALFLFRTGKRDIALTEFEKLAKEDPKDRASRTRLLAAYEAMGKMPQALRLLAGALKENPKDADALLERAELFLKAGNVAGAKNDLNQVLHFKVDSAQAHYALSEVHREEGSLPAQRRELQEALRLNARLLPARLALSKSFIASNEPKPALQVLDETPENQKDAMAVIAERNWALFAAGNFKEMRAILDRTLKAGGSAELSIQDAILKMRDGDYPGARAAADGVLSQNPQEIRAARIVTDSYLAQKQPLKAMERLSELVREHPKSAPLENLLGQYHLGNGNPAEARKAFETAKSVDPTFLPADLALAQLDRNENHPDAARQHLAVVLAGEPRNIRGLLMLADIEGNTGNPAGAIAKYRAVLDIDSSNFAALNNLAYTLALENPDEALKYAQRAGEIAPDSAAVQDTLGWIYYRKGIYSTAVNYLETAVARESTPRRQFHLGMSYIKAGHKDLGQTTLNAALQKDPALLKTERGW